MNKLMAKLSLALLLCLSMGLSSLMAQQGARKGHGDRDMTAKIEAVKAELNLSDKQVRQLTELRADTQAKMEKIRATDYAGKEDRRAAMVQLRQEQKAQVEKILTKKQLAQWKEIRQEQRAERQGAKQGRGERRLKTQPGTDKM